MLAYSYMYMYMYCGGGGGFVPLSSSLNLFEPKSKESHIQEHVAALASGCGLRMLVTSNKIRGLSECESSFNPVVVISPNYAVHSTPSCASLQGGKA